jgi:hypothetical protein
MVPGTGRKTHENDSRPLFPHKSKYPDAYEHAVASGRPSGPFTKDPGGKLQRRADNLRGREKVPGKDLDEWPPAMFKEGQGASVCHINQSHNRGSGATIGNGTRDVPTGGQVIIDWTE